MGILRDEAFEAWYEGLDDKGGIGGKALMQGAWQAAQTALSDGTWSAAWAKEHAPCIRVTREMRRVEAAKKAELTAIYERGVARQEEINNRLRAENERLRVTLTTIANNAGGSFDARLIRHVAVQALSDIRIEPCCDECGDPIDPSEGVTMHGDPPVRYDPYLANGRRWCGCQRFHREKEHLPSDA